MGALYRVQEKYDQAKKAVERALEINENNFSALINYANILTKKNSLVSQEKEELINLLRTSLDKKLLNKVKEVQYDRELGIIKNIPQLTFNNINRKFVFKRSEKHVSTIKSLAVKKNNSLDKNLETLTIKDN